LPVDTLDRLRDLTTLRQMTGAARRQTDEFIESESYSNRGRSSLEVLIDVAEEQKQRAEVDTNRRVESCKKDAQDN
jgi:hypothetical protein